MKDEDGGTAIYKFIVLKSKMYSTCDVKKKEKSVHKGHNSYISNEEYKDILINKKIIRHKMRGIKSANHKISTYESIKISLSCYDDKRYVLFDGINTLRYWHKDIPK